MLENDDDDDDAAETFERYPCTIDIPLNNPDLPFLGDDDTVYKDHETFKNNFLIREEIEAMMIDEQQKKDDSKTADGDDDEGP